MSISDLNITELQARVKEIPTIEDIADEFDLQKKRNEPRNFWS